MSLKQKIIYKNKNHLSFAEYGNHYGYPILIQHGLIASIDDYDLFDQLIQRNLRVICIARPGYGESSPYLMNSFAEWADIVSVLISNLGVFRFDVLGISSGAPYSYSLGYRFPDKVGNIYVLSGTPALYDEIVQSNWPYPLIEDRDIAELQDLAHELFFSNLSPEDLKKNDIRDSMMYNGFGVAQDLRLRFMKWGFALSDVKTPVYMRHSKTDDAVPFTTAIRTAELLSNSQLELVETGPHFSKEVLDDFIETTIVENMDS